MLAVSSLVTADSSDARCHGTVGSNMIPLGKVAMRIHRNQTMKQKETFDPSDQGGSQTKASKFHPARWLGKIWRDIVSLATDGPNKITAQRYLDEQTSAQDHGHCQLCKFPCKKQSQNY